MADTPFGTEQHSVVAVLYGTFDGHTRVVAERVASDLQALGFAAELHNFQNIPATFDLGRCVAAVVLAPIRLGEHGAHMAEYVKAHRTRFESMPVAFISTVLSPAGADPRRETPEQQAGYAADMQAVLDRFFQETGWRPAYVKPAADQTDTPHNFVARFLVRLVTRKAGAGTDNPADYAFTDWDHLDDFVSVFGKAVRGTRRARPGSEMGE